MWIKVLMLVVFFAVMLAIGLYCRRHSTDVNGFVLGGRNVGPWLTAFAYGTSYFSAVIFVGYAGQFGWKYGIAASWVGIGNAFLGSLLAWAVLGRRTRIMTQHLGSATMPEFFGRRFGSRTLKIIASIIIFIFLNIHDLVVTDEDSQGIVILGEIGLAGEVVDFKNRESAVGNLTVGTDRKGGGDGFNRLVQAQSFEDQFGNDGGGQGGKDIRLDS